MSNFVNPDLKNSGTKQNISEINYTINDLDDDSLNSFQTDSSKLKHQKSEGVSSSTDLDGVNLGNGVNQIQPNDHEKLNDNSATAKARAGNAAYNTDNSGSNSTIITKRDPIYNGTESQIQPGYPGNSKEPSSGFMIISLRHETKGKREKRPSNSGFDQPAVLPKKSTQNDHETPNMVEDRTPSAGEDESDDEETDDNDDDADDDIPDTATNIADGKQSSQAYMVRNPSSHSTNIPKVPPMQPVYQPRLNQQPWSNQPKFSQNNGSASIWPNQTGVGRISRLNAPGMNSPAVYQEGFGPPLHNNMHASTIHPFKTRSSAEDTPASNITMECSQATSPPNNDYINEHSTTSSEEVNQPASRFRKARIQERIELWREGRSCFHDCRVKTVPSKVLDLVSAKVDPTLPSSVIARCPFCSKKMQEFPCGCVDNYATNQQESLSRVSSADIQPYLGAFWLHGKRIHLYPNATGNEPNPSSSAGAISTPGETPRLQAEVSTSSLTAYDYQSDAFDAQGLSRSDSVNSPHSSLDMDALLGGTTGNQSGSGYNGSAPMPVGAPLSATISDEPVDINAGVDNDKVSTKLESPRSVKSGSVVKSVSPETISGEERRKDICCIEQPAPPTSPASGLLERLVSPGSAVDPHLPGVLPPNNRPVQVVTPATVSSQHTAPSGSTIPTSSTSTGSQLPSVSTTSIQQPGSLIQPSRQPSIPTSVSTYPDHRTAPSTNVPNPPTESRIENKINASLDVVRMALMTTFREEMESMRHELNYLREQNRIQQEKYDRVLSILRSYVPQEVWDQQVAPSYPYHYANPQTTGQTTSVMTSQPSIPPGGPVTSATVTPVISHLSNATLPTGGATPGGTSSK